VAEAFADDLDRHPFLDQEAPVGVAEAVEPDRDDAGVAGLASGRWTS
jgi:hypothetical protein